MSKTDYTPQAEAIAAELGGTAEPQTREYMNGHFYVPLPKLDPDAKLLLRLSPYHAKDRVVVSLCYPQKSTKGHTVTAGTYLRRDTLEELGYVSEITVSLKKSAAQIAADIKRRILPAYLKALELVRVELAKEAGEEGKRDEVIRRLADAAGLPHPDANQRRLHLYRSTSASPTSATVELHSSNECSVELRWVPPAIAEQILKLVTQNPA